MGKAECGIEGKELGLGIGEQFLGEAIDVEIGWPKEDVRAAESIAEGGNDQVEGVGFELDGQNDGNRIVRPGADLASGGKGEEHGFGIKSKGMTEGAPKTVPTQLEGEKVVLIEGGLGTAGRFTLAI